MYSLRNVELCADFSKFNRVFKIAIWGQFKTFVAYFEVLSNQGCNYLATGKVGWQIVLS